MEEVVGARRQRRSALAPGRVLADLAVMLADGGVAIGDLAVLRDQPDLFGPVASTATAARSAYVWPRLPAPTTTMLTGSLMQPP